jgi:CRISPR/Cas system CSM-associated protein Csm3 (group 7 of RAMP superfamily)
MKFSEKQSGAKLKISLKYAVKVCCKFDPDSRPTAIEILAMLKEEHKNHEEILVGSSTERGYFN